MPADVSVIIVSYFTGSALWLSIASALQQPECCEVLLVNNGNFAGDEKRLLVWQRREPRLKILSGHGNVGFGKGNNLAATQATGDYVLLLNPDSMLPEGGLALFLEQVRKSPENTLAGGYLMNPDGSEQRGGRRALLTLHNAISESLGMRWFLAPSDRLNYHTQPMPDTTHEVPAISGACMFLSRAFYQKLQGFDERYFLHMEDMDLCFRVHQAGGKIICVPTVKILHFRSTSDTTNAFIEKHKAKGFILYLQKHFAAQYNATVMQCIAAGIWLRAIFKIVFSTVNTLFIHPLAAQKDITRLALLYWLTRFAKSDSSLVNKTILVTGGDSAIGIYLIGSLLARGARVIAGYSGYEVPFSHPHLKWEMLDFSTEETYASCSLIRADILLHAAPLRSLPELLKQAKEHFPKRIIAYSSYLACDPLVFKDSFEANRIKAQKALENDILSYASETRHITILRPFMPYGTGLDDEFTHLVDIIKRRGIIWLPGKAEGLRNPVHIKDILNATLQIFDRIPTYGQIYNLGGCTQLTYREMVVRLFEYIGKPVKIITVSMLPRLVTWLGSIYRLPHLNREAAHRPNRHLVSDNTVAIRDFSYTPAAFMEEEAFF